MGSVSFTDPGADEWTAMVDYGDGSLETLEMIGKTFPLSHTYAGSGSGPFTVTVTVTDDEGGANSGAAEVAVIYPLTIDQATVKLAKKRWRRRHGTDTYVVHGRLPLSLLQRFDPADEELTIAFAGLEQVISAGSFVRRNHRWAFKASRWSRGVRRIDLHDDGRFKIQAKNPYGSDLHDVDFRSSVDLSLSLGPDIGEASIQLNRRLRFRSRCRGGCREHVNDDDDDRDDDDVDNHDDDDDRKQRLRRFLRRLRKRR